MKISISYWGLEGGLDGSRPVKEALQEAKDLGFDAIELGIRVGNTTHQFTVAIDGRTYAAAHLEADLRRVAGAGDDLVLTGTITLRLTPQG